MVNIALTRWSHAWSVLVIFGGYFFLFTPGEANIPSDGGILEQLCQSLKESKARSNSAELPEACIEEPGSAVGEGPPPAKAGLSEPKRGFVTPSATDLQTIIDQAEEGSTVKPPAGIYSGPIVIRKAITLDGANGVTIDAGGEGTVVLLKTNGAVLRNLHLTGSGKSHNDLDAGVQVRGNFNVIKDNVIDDSLFGIDLQESEHNVVRRNRISSKEVELGRRGDAIRLWYSFNNRVTHNTIVNSRDFVVWYSRDNVIANNRATGGRYSLHFMYSQYNLVENNQFIKNSVGIFLMYSDGVTLRNNRVTHSMGPTGIGIGLKETSDVVIENNEILYSAVGLYLDVSPYQPDSTNQYNNNTIAYNGIGIEFLNDWTGNHFKNNTFTNNITQVAVKGATTAKRNVWDGNYWDDYRGFDRDSNGVGDTVHEDYTYADRLWMDVPPAQFFKGSPVLELLDFLERLAPFTPPSLVLTDRQPLMFSPQETW